jgi:hypothetical protein
MRHAAAHGVASLHPLKFAAVVCVASGLTALGTGGFAVGSKMFGSPAASEIAAATGPPLSFDTSRVDNLLPSLIASSSSMVESAPKTPLSYDWHEADRPLDSRLSFDWSEIGNIPDTPSRNENSAPPDISSVPVGVPEPASIAIMAGSLFAIGAFSRCLRNHAR